MANKQTQPKIRNAKKVYCLLPDARFSVYEDDRYLYRDDIKLDFPKGIYVTAYSKKQARVYIARRIAKARYTPETTAIYDYRIEFSEINCVDEELEKSEQELKTNG